MRHIELHILQSVPVSCLNRDDLGSPKTAVFGGVKRARVSSQSWKRAIREYAKEIAPDCFAGIRTKLLVDSLAPVLAQKGLVNGENVTAAESIADALATIDNQTSASGMKRVKTLFFTSPNEVEKLAQAYLDSGKDAKKAVKASKVDWSDAADIALFGRMVANEHSLTVEGAGMFSHAISTHKADTEMDFYSAVDDAQPDEESGAGMIGTLEFQSATFYRFVAVNLDMLADADHLGKLSAEQRKKTMAAFIEAVLKAVPSARRNSMNGNTLPGYVLGIVREHGHPIQLVNAFERPIRTSNEGFFATSVKSLREEGQTVKSKWGIVSEAEFELSSESPTTFAQFVDGLVEYVR